MEYSTEEGGFRYIPFRIYQVGQNPESLLLFGQQASRCRQTAAQQLLQGWRVMHQLGNHRLRDIGTPWPTACSCALVTTRRG